MPNDGTGNDFGAVNVSPSNEPEDAQLRDVLNKLQAKKAAASGAKARHIAVSCTLLEGVIAYLGEWVRER